MTKPKGVFKKRRNKGNRFYRISSVLPEPQTENVEGECGSQCSSPPSASKRKLSSTSYTDYHQDKESDVQINIIIDFNILVSIFSDVVCCAKCGGHVSIVEDVSQRNGLACKLKISCSNCDIEKSFWNSEKCCMKDLYEINVRLFYGMRCIGKGLTASKVLCGMLNLPNPPTNYCKYTSVVGDSVFSVAETSMKAAVEEAVDIEGNKDICIAFDGSWQKRGHVSKNSCATVTSVDTGKVIDVEVLTKYCQGCTLLGENDDKKSAHHTVCNKNYEGTSGGMEISAANAIFNRSEQARGVRYVKFLGDGDSKSFKAVIESKPYGDTVITKLECVGHVQKRMGTRLRRLKAQYGEKKLSDGKSIKGVGRLCDKVIDKLQNYYGNAIRGNSNNLQAMKTAVWATFFHRGSSDEKPIHDLCPPPPDTWCKYRKAEAAGTVETFHHRNAIPEAVMEAIKPIYRDLAKPELLQKCLHGKTQNNNESFNNVIWSRIPKNVFVGKKTLQLGVWDAVITFNDGNVGRLRVLQELGFNNLGSNTTRCFQDLDQLRIQKAEIAAENMTKRARRERRNKKLGLEDTSQDPDYGAGCF